MSNRQKPKTPKAKTTWPLSEKVADRLAKARDSKQLEEKIAVNNFQVRMTEILAIGRPDDAPDEAVYDGKVAFCLPEFLPDAMKRAMGISIETPDSPQPSTEEDQVVDSIGG